MRSAVKLRLDVDERTVAILDSQSRIANWLYNHLLEQANLLRQEFVKSQDAAVGKTLYSQRGLRNLIPGIKEQHGFVKSLYSSVAKNVAMRLSLAIREYQKSRHGKRGKPVSWPRFRAWKRNWFSLQYEEPWKGYALSGKEIKLSLGKDDKGKQLHVALPLAEPLPAFFAAEDVCQLRITKEAARFYAVFTIERSLPPAQTQPPARVIALDPNHKNFAYGVDTLGQATEIANPYFLKPLDKQIDAIKARRDHCKAKSRQITREDGTTFWLPSRRWQFFDARLQTLYFKRREQTKTYLYTIANRLLREYDAVSVGSYTPHGGGISRKMRRAMNNESLIGRFKLTLAWLANRSGRISLVWEEQGSTRTCHDCDCVVADGLDPSVRFWICPACQRPHVRDENAAQNGLQRTLQKLSLPCSGRRAVSARRAWRFNGLGVEETPGITDGQVALAATLPPAKKLNLNVTR